MRGTPPRTGPIPRPPVDAPEDPSERRKPQETEVFFLKVLCHFFLLMPSFHFSGCLMFGTMVSQVFDLLRTIGREAVLMLVLNGFKV